jgi:hypothetical protein
MKDCWLVYWRYPESKPPEPVVVAAVFSHKASAEEYLRRLAERWPQGAGFCLQNTLYDDAALIPTP